MDSQKERELPTAAVQDRFGRVDHASSSAATVAELRAARRAIVDLEAQLARRASVSAMAEARFHRLFDSNSIGIIICDIHGDITEANDAFLEIVGHTHDDLPLRWDQMTPPDRRGLDEAKVEELISTGAGIAWEKEYFDRDGRRVPILVAVTLLDPSSGECMAIVHDLSERKQLEAALRESEEMYRTVYDNIPLMYLTLAIDGTIRSVNSHGAAELGYTPDALLGRSVLQLVAREDHAVVEPHLSVLRTRPAPVEYWEARMVRAAGGILWTRAAARIACGTDGEDMVLVVCADVTRRRQAEQLIVEQKQGLRALTSRLGLAEEHERRRIATGLHDEIGQTLAMAKLTLGRTRVSDRDKASRAIQEVDALLGRAIGEIRSLTFELSSPVLYEFGLEAALQSLGEEMAQRHDMRFECESETAPAPLAGDLPVLLYRITRELLHNTVKHARARHVRVRIRTSGDEIEITVADDGFGFDVTGAGHRFDATGGYGLFSVSQQLKHIGGRFEIESAPGRGTRAVVVAPLTSTGEHAT